MSKEKASFKDNIAKLGVRISKLRAYALPIFIIFVALIYGYLFLSINSLVGTTPSDADVDSQVKAAHVPAIDEDVVKQLQSLKDNSVNVQSLFENARNNPFQ